VRHPNLPRPPIDIAHIEPRKPDGANDVFDNLIALCANCHRRYDAGEIDRPAMRQYKANLSVLNSRYGDLERRVLQQFADEPEYTAIQLPGGLEILLKYLLEDGLVRIAAPAEVGASSHVIVMGVPSQEYVAITPKGTEFIARWLQAQDLEAT
jgi:hypothetical protein